MKGVGGVGWLVGLEGLGCPIWGCGGEETLMTVQVGFLLKMKDTEIRLAIKNTNFQSHNLLISYKCTCIYIEIG